MLKRMFLMLAVMLMFIAVLGLVKFQQIQTAIAKGAAFQPPPAAVTTIVAAQEAWPATLSAIGTMAAVQGVTVSADLFDAELRLAQTRRNELLAMVQLYRALGGGWQ